jgi:hypothetical protein
MSKDFITQVRAAGATENYTHIVKVANADEIGNAIEVANEAARPTPSLALQGLLYYAKAENTYWTVNSAGNAWVSGLGGAGSGDMVKATYDPTNIAGDAFLMDNMVEGALTKILTDAERIKLAGIQANATADQTNAEIETAYNAQVSAMSQVTAEAGTSTTVERVTAERIKQAILKLTPVELGFAVSDETTDLTAGTAKLTFRMPFAMNLTGIRIGVNTAPTGSALTVDVNETGVSLLSTKLTIDAGEKTSETAATPPVISDSALANDAEITVDLDSAGTTIAGNGLKIWFIGTRA